MSCESASAKNLLESMKASSIIRNRNMLNFADVLPPPPAICCVPRALLRTAGIPEMWCRVSPPNWVATTACNAPTLCACAILYHFCKEAKDCFYYCGFACPWRSMHQVQKGPLGQFLASELIFPFLKHTTNMQLNDRLLLSIQCSSFFFYPFLGYIFLH